MAPVGPRSIPKVLGEERRLSEHRAPCRRVTVNLGERALEPVAPCLSLRRPDRSGCGLVGTSEHGPWSGDIERHEALSNRAVVKGHSCWSVAADWFEVEGSLIPGTWVRVASSPDKAGTHQHCQMVSGPANETGRCNDSEPAYERLSRENHQLDPDRSGLGCGAHPCERGTPWPVDVAGREATVNACGVAVARPQGHSWTPHLSNGSRVNVGTGQLVPSPARHQRVEGKACRRLMPTGRGGGVLVVRGRESRSHGEGPQCVRSIHADRGGRW